MKAKKLIDSFNYAIDGIIYALRTQKNMRIHFCIAVVVLIGCLFFNLSRIELLMIFFAICLVIVMEMINTAIENAIDLFANHYHPLAKIAKNVAAGAVLIAALNAVLVGYLIFFDKLKPVAGIMVDKVKQSSPHITFIVLIITMLIVIAVKAWYGEGTPLKGGMPSGHSAIAFSSATIILLISKDALIATLSFLMAFMVAQTRVEADVHTEYETFIGALIGIITTILIFQLFQ